VKAAAYWGCMVPTIQYGYEMSVREVLPKIGIELHDLENVSCCGTPVQSVNSFAALYLAARNLAIAEKTGLENLLVVCNGCHLSLSEAKHFLGKDEKLRAKIETLLREEGLEYKGSIQLWHVVDFLHDVVKEDAIKSFVKKGLNGLKFASHYGCHIIRPSTIRRVDDAENPKKLDNLIKLLGAEAIEYPEKLDCCGSLLLLSHPDAALTFTGLKLKAVQELGVDGFIVACPSCQMMFDMRQKSAGATVGAKLNLPVLYYTQLLGIAMGIETEKLGLHLNRSPVDELLAKIK
jgi:heterodisulfide reductase subunit B